MDRKRDAAIKAFMKKYKAPRVVAEAILDGFAKTKKRLKK